MGMPTDSPSETPPTPDSTTLAPKPPAAGAVWYPIPVPGPTPGPADDEIGPSTLYDAFCGRAGRQEDLINRRLTWMLTTQGFLFGALAVAAATAKDKDKDPAIASLLKAWLPVLGAAVAWSSLGANLIAHGELRRLQATWNGHLGRDPRLGMFPDILNLREGYMAKLGPSLLLPALIGFAWIWILVAANWHR